MIKDVMVRLDGKEADEMRLAAVDRIADEFDSQVIGLYFNVLPLPVPPTEDGVGAVAAIEVLEKARAAGDRVEAALARRLERLGKPTEIRRFDVFSDETATIAAREARAADAFVALRPNGRPQDPERLVEGVLFGSGRHIFLVPEGKRPKAAFDHILGGGAGPARQRGSEPPQTSRH